MVNNEKKFFWEITPGHFCNLECKSCYAAENARPDHRLLDWKSLEKAQNKAIDIGMSSLEILGGEPLLHQDIEHFVSNFKKRVPAGFCGIVSNGTLVSENKAKALKEAGLDQLTISIDGTNAEINDKNRGLNSFNRALRGAENAMKAGIGVTLAYTVNPYNTSDTPNIFSFAQKYGFEAIGLQILEISGRARNTFKNEKDFNRIVGLDAIIGAYDLPKQYLYSEVNTRNKFKTLLNRFYNAGMELPSIRCDGGTETFMISSGGDFLPCSQYAYGPNGEIRNRGVNLTTENSNLIDNFQEQYLDFNHKMSLLENTKFSSCQNCEHYDSCAPCPLINPSGIVPECEWVDSKTKELNNLVRSSDVLLKILPEPVNESSISFKVRTQEEPLTIPLDRQKFHQIMDQKKVSEMEKMLDLDLVEFLCKLRSHQVLSLSNFIDIS